MEIVMKIHNCTTCGESDPNNFYKGKYSICKECKKVRAKVNRSAREGRPYNKRGSQVHDCTSCGEKNPDNFRKTEKSTCKKCKYNNERERLKGNEEFLKVSRLAVLKWQRDNIIQFRLNSARARARKKGIPFSITKDDIELLLHMQDHRCVYSGRVFDNESYKMDSMSIDQIEPSKGYTIDNIELVTSYVNTMKNDKSREEFLEVVKNITENLGLCK